MKRLIAVLVIGLGLSAVAWALGGMQAMAGGLLATGCQLAAVALLRPRMRAATGAFLAAWGAGMGLRLTGLAVAVIFIAPLEGGLGYLGVLLPLLFAEIQFLK